MSDPDSWSNANYNFADLLPLPFPSSSPSIEQPSSSQDKSDTARSTHSCAPNLLMVIQARIAEEPGHTPNITLSALIDTGSSISLIRDSSIPPSLMKQCKTQVTRLMSFDGHITESQQILEVPLTIHNTTVLVKAVVVQQLSHDIIIGTSDLREARTYITLDPYGVCIRINDTNAQTLSPNEDSPELIAFASEVLFPNLDSPNDLSYDKQPSHEDQLQLRIKALSNEFADVLTDHLEIGGAARVPPHNIVLKEGAKPINSHEYRQNPFKLGELKKIINEMLQAGVIRPHIGPWASPVVLVQKKDGSWRFCIDYRRVNEVTVIDAYTIPRMDELIERLAGSTRFSVLDLASGYWQLSITDEMASVLAFKVNGETFAPTVMPFGWNNAPSAFQRAMNYALRECSDFAAVYIDDIIIYSKTDEEHIHHVRSVLSALRKANLRVKRSKCRWACTEALYLGHIVSKDGIRPNPALIQAIRDMAEPKNKQELRSFLGLTGFYRRFVKSYSLIAAPLTDLLKEAAPFDWSTACAKAAHTLRNSISKDATLSYPKFDGRPFYLDTDASLDGMGAVLSQKDDNNILRPIGYVSKKFNEAQKGYDATKREALALRMAFQSFHYYLEATPVPTIVRTDNEGLVGMIKNKTWSGLVWRWFHFMLAYNFQIQYIPGPKNVVADALSRKPALHNAGTVPEDPNDEPTISIFTKDVAHCMAIAYALRDHSPIRSPPIHIVSNLKANQHTMNDEDVSLFFEGETLTFSEWQKQDPDIIRLIEWYNDPSKRPNKKLTRGLKHSSLVLSKKNVLLIRKHDTARLRAVVPHRLRNILMTEHHSSPLYGGHRGRSATLDKLAERYWWPNMKADVIAHVTSCHPCAKARHNHNSKKAPIVPQPPVSDLFNRVGMDMVGPLPPSKEGCEYILVLIDHYSHWVEAYPLHETTSEKIAEVLVREFIPRFGCPQAFLTDQGSNFNSDFMTEFYRIMQSKKLTTTAYHPQCNGLTEQVNGTIKNALTRYVQSHPSRWQEFLPWVLHAYRTTKSPALGGLSPFQILYGTESRHPMDRAIFDPEKNPDAISIQNSAYLKSVDQFRTAARRLLLHNYQVKTEKMKERVNKNRTEHTFRPGESVYLENPPSSLGTPALHNQRDGPYLIIPSLLKHERTVRIRGPDGKESTVSPDRLSYAPPHIPPVPPAIIITKENKNLPITPAETPHESQESSTVILNQKSIHQTNGIQKPQDPKLSRLFHLLVSLLPAKPPSVLPVVLNAKEDLLTPLLNRLNLLIQDGQTDGYLLRRQQQRMTQDLEKIKPLCSNLHIQPLHKLISWWLADLAKRTGFFTNNNTASKQYRHRFPQSSGEN
jgi:hypothetical protein